MRLASSQVKRIGIMYIRLPSFCKHRNSLATICSPWPISTEGGRLPVWHPNGKELFYLTASRLMAVDVTANASGFHAGVPHSLFDIRTVQNSAAPTFSPYSISSDGNQFFFAIPQDSERKDPLTVILNWPVLLGR